MAILVALFVSFATFLMLRVAGDPAIAMAGEGATAADIEYIRQRFGFDRSLLAQYLDWFGKAVSGDFGRSTYFSASVATLLAERLPVTLTLGVCALSLSIAVALPLGVVAAVRPNSLIDRLALTFAVLGQAVPNFWFALMLIVVLSVWFPVLPPSGNETWLHFIMPTLVLGYYSMPAIMRLVRSGMLETLGTDYIRTARAKGLARPRILFRHALRNAVIPVVSLSAVQFGYLLGGSIIIESIFALHGIGQLAWESIARADLPTVQGIVLVLSMIYVLLNLAGDLLNAWLDPRLRVA